MCIVLYFVGGSSNDIAFIAGIVAGVIAAIIIIVIIVIAIKMILVIRRRRRIPKFFREPTERPSPEPVARYLHMLSIVMFYHDI